MQVETVPLASLVEDPANARKHAPKNLEAIKGSLAKFGQQKLIVVGQNNVVIAGNGTLRAARALGWDSIDINRSDLEGTEAMAFALADNRAGELAEWDAEILGDTLKGLLDVEFDLSSIGFDSDDLAKMLGTEEPKEGLTDDDQIPEHVETRSQPGDLWILGSHRVLCGDSTDVLAVERLMGGERADMVFTDPPYNQHIGIAVSKNCEERNVRRTRRLKDSDLNDFEPEEFLAVLSSLNVSSVYIFHSKDLIAAYIDYFEKLGLNWELLAATKMNPMPFRKGHYLNDIEWLIFSKQPGSYFNEDLDQAYYSKFRSMRQVNGAEHYHPTRKDVGFIEPFIKISSRTSVLDLFLGSGSTLIACEKTSRRCFGMEIDPHYVDVIITRWEAFTGLTATLESSCQTDSTTSPTMPSPKPSKSPSKAPSKRSMNSASV